METGITIFDLLKRRAKRKHLKYNELLLKMYYSCMPLPLNKISNISLMGSRKYPYFKLAYHWGDGDACLLSFDAKRFCRKVLIGYLDGYGVYSISQIDLNLLSKFLTDLDFRRTYINNKNYVNLKDFEWMER